MLDSFQLFLEALDKKLGKRETEQQFNHNRECEGDVWARMDFLHVYTGLDLL